MDCVQITESIYKDSGMGSDIQKKSSFGSLQNVAHLYMRHVILQHIIKYKTLNVKTVVCDNCNDKEYVVLIGTNQKHIKMCMGCYINYS